MKEWYCGVDGKALGPFGENALRDMIQRGELKPNTPVWNGDPENAARGWVSAADTEIAPLFAGVLGVYGRVSQSSEQVPYDGYDQTQDLPDITLATSGQRFLAVLFDAVISVMVGGGAAFFATLIMASHLNASKEGGAQAVSIVLALYFLLVAIPCLGYAGYNVYLLKKNGQTLGKKIMCIKITNMDGSSASLNRIIFMRGLPLGIVSIIPIIGAIIFIVDICFIFREDGRTLHDRIAGTIVIKD
jgi:uncharacterized RDD family membrane protein YckC